MQLLSRVQLFAAPWTTACQASISITNSWIPPKPMSIESVMPSNHLTPCHPFSSCPQSFPASGSFQMSQLFATGGQSIEVSSSASGLPVNIQDWFLDRMDRMDLLAVQGTSLAPQFKSINSSALSSLYSPTLIFIPDYWKNHYFD